MKNLSYSVFGTLQASFNKKKYDVVHAWNVPSAFIMRKITAKMKILSVHGVYSQQIGMLHSKLTGSIIKSKESQVLDRVVTVQKETLNTQGQSSRSPVETQVERVQDRAQ